MSSYTQKHIKGPPLFPSDLEMEKWEDEVNSLKDFVRVSKNNRRELLSIIENDPDFDSYLISPFYYAFTGREGLWLYKEKGGCVPLCWHPNIGGQILVFPPRGKYNFDILRNLLNKMPIPPAGIRLARIKDCRTTTSLITSVVNTYKRSIYLAQKEENILDWKYPIRILSTESITKMDGNDYLRIRNHIKQMRHHKVYVEPLSTDKTDEVLGFVRKWAHKRAKTPHNFRNLVSPYVEAMSLFKDRSLNLEGRIFYVNGNVQAVTMLDLPYASRRVANSWVNLCNTEFRGLSEFVMWTTSKALFEQGIPYINYGGSETKGLDDYKKKFIPTLSLGLSSIDVIVKEHNGLAIPSFAV